MSVSAAMFDVTEQVGLGLGWGGDVHILRTCTHELDFHV